MKKRETFGLDVKFDGLCVELGHAGLNKKKEFLCGDFYRIAENETDHVLVLSDGLGSGVKANVLSTLTATMLCNMVANHVEINEAVRTVAKTLPICSVRHLAYSTFTVLDLNGNHAALYQYDNPQAILLRDGKVVDYPVSEIEVEEKTLQKSSITLQENDLLILMSDGVTNAGMGKTTNGGWGIEAVRDFCERKYRTSMSAKEMAVRIAEAGVDLNLNETDDDITVLVLKVRKEQMVNLMIGPPENSEEDLRYLKNFFEKSGKHIICGGSTAEMAARYLGAEVISLPSEEKSDLPAHLRLKGVDLVTEGYLTLKRLLEYCDECETDCLSYLDLKRNKNDAQRLAELLFEEATGIRVYFGNAYNEAYRNMKISAKEKEKMVYRLLDHLRKAGKEVEIAYWAV